MIKNIKIHYILDFFRNKKSMELDEGIHFLKCEFLFLKMFIVIF
jgi:hypothetical protein